MCKRLHNIILKKSHLHPGNLAHAHIRAHAHAIIYKIYIAINIIYIK